MFFVSIAIGETFGSYLVGKSHIIEKCTKCKTKERKKRSQPALESGNACKIDIGLE